MKTTVNDVQISNDAAHYHLAKGDEVIIEDRYVARLKAEDGQAKVIAPDGSLLAEDVSIEEAVAIGQAFAQLCYIPKHDAGEKEYLHLMEEQPTIHHVGGERYVGLPHQNRVARVRTDYLGPHILAA